MKAILAVNNLGYIGLYGVLPWRNAKDLQHFKKLTLNSKLLVGRRTFDTLPLLKDREMIVVGRSHNTLEKALTLKPDWVIGGKRLLESTLHLCTELHLSHINDNTVGDVKMPSLEQFKGKVIDYHF